MNKKIAPTITAVISRSLSASSVPVVEGLSRVHTAHFWDMGERREVRVTRESSCIYQTINVYVSGMHNTERILYVTTTEGVLKSDCLLDTVVDCATDAIANYKAIRKAQRSETK